MHVCSSFARRVAVGRAFRAIRSASLAALLLSFSLYASSAFAGLSGTKNIPGDYATLAAAITDLNTQGVDPPGVTLNLIAGNAQTAPIGGYAITTLTGAVGAPIVIQGNGNTITAANGQVVGQLNDAIFKLIGADYVTLTGFVMQENPANTINTPAASNNMTEWGVALLYASLTDGAQNNTIQGNTISLNRTYLNTFGVYSNTRHSATAVSTSAEVTAASGSNSNNKVYTNTISNVNYGIVFIGAGTTIAAIDSGNDIGGASVATGNTITNWGSGAALSSYISLTGNNYCIFSNQQINDNVSFNTITSAALAQGVTTGGFLKNYSAGQPVGTFTSTINNNTVQVTNNPTSATAGAVIGLNNQGLTPLNANAAMSMNNNVVQNSFVGGTVSTTNGFTGVTNLSAAGTVNMTGNSVINSGITATTATTGNVVGISNSGAAGTVNLNSNIVRSLTSSATTTGQVQGVANSGVVVTAININNNQLGNATSGFFSSSVASTGALFGAVNAGGAATALLTMQGNDIRGTVYNVLTGATQNYYNNQTYTGSVNISNNTITNITANTSGAVTMIGNSVTRVTGATATVNNNSIVTGFTKATGTGTVAFYNSFGSSLSTVTEINTGNNFSNVTLAGATPFIGWRSADGTTPGPRKTVTNNTFSNITGGTAAFTSVLYVGFSDSTFANNNVSGNVISNVSNGSSINAIFSDGQNQNFFNNTINGISATGTGAVVNAFSITGATTQNIYKNKIYDLQSNNATGTVNGILFSAGTTANIYNNLIGDLRAPATNSISDAVRGITITSATATSTINVSYNSILLNASSTGTDFNTSGIFHTTSATATTAALNLRNNVIVNNSTPAGTGVTAAYRRSSATLTNYGSASNNNDFYAGTPSASRLIFFDGTNSDQTLAAYKARVASRDSASVSENPTFVSTTGSSPSFLHINTVTPTQLESGGITISGITDDFDGDVRNVSTPDIGADEFNGVLLDVIAPSINYTPLAGTASTANRTLTTTITDATGVPTSGIGLPVLYYRKGASDPFVSTQGVSTGGSGYSFTFNYALVTGGSVMAGDSIQYYVVAQDTVTPTANVGSNPSAGASGYTPNPPAAATPPTAPSSYTILPSISGSKTVGTGGDYPTLTAAAAAINGAVLTGPTTLSLTDPTYGAETLPIVINANAGSSAANTVTIKPAAGVTPAISGSSATCLLIVNGADWVVVDGSNTVGGITRDLSMTNTSTGTSSAVVCLQTAAGPDGATNNTVKNVNIAGTSITATPGTLFGVFSGSPTISVTSTGTGNNNNTVLNNAITKSVYGVYSSGASAAIKNTGTAITQNVMNAASPNNITTGGVLLRFEDGAQVNQNDISVLKHDGTIGTTGTAFGIALGLVPSNNVTIFTGSDVTNGQVRRNRINGVTQMNATGFSTFGIVINAVTSGTTLVSNNMVSGVVSPSTASDFSGSIIAGGGTGSTTQIYYNSVSMTGLRGAGASFPSYGLAIGSGNPIVDVRDNAFYNAQTSGSTGKMYAIANASTAFTNMTSNYNDLFVSGASGFVGQTGGLGTAGTDRVALSDWQTATGTDANSISVDPLFVSTSDLHLQTSPLSPLESAGTAIVAITTDFDNDPRPATKPDIGADELVSALTITPATAAFGNQLINTTSTELTVTLANTGAGSLDVTTLDAAAAPFARTGTGTCAATLPITIAPGASCTLTYTFAPTATGAASQTLTVTSNGPGSGTIALSGTGTQGNLTITPTSVPFGNQLVGTTSTEQTVTLANTGTASLDVTTLTAAAAPFARTGTGTCAMSPTITIAASASCTLTYTFAPTATGAANQTLTVTANAPGSGTIALSGTGTQGNLTISPTSVPFGNVAVGSNSGPTAVTLANTGNAPLTVTALTAASAPFSRTGGNCSAVPITIPASGSCTLGYEFAPTATGAANQNLTVTANAPGSGSIALSGTGVQGALTIAPTSVPFGNQAVGSTSGAMTVTLGNSGGASLQVTALTPAAAPFALSGGSCGSVPITIAASGNCTLTYTFAPTAAGLANQTLTVTANVPGSGTIALSGTGTQGTLTITPPSVNFGTQTLNTTTAESTVTLANTGASSLDVTVLTPAAAPFVRTATGSCSPTTPITIASMGSCTLTYTFTPTATGPANQTLTVTSNGTGSGTIALSGTGAGPGGVCSTGMPIETTATAGTAGPTGYANLKAGFDAINAGTHQGSIQMAVCADTTEAASAVLNASGAGAAAYTSVLVNPANGGARTISGSLAAPLVDLNGADNVTIDGLNTGGNALTISNTSIAATAGTSTIRFIGGATGNTVTRTNLLGSSTTTLATAGGGTVYFADDAVTPNGNDNNTISSNNIGPAGGNLPNKAIYGLGTTTTLANGNSGVVITDNNIYDFFNVASSVSGIYVASGNDSWTMSGNRIFQTTARTFTAATPRYAGITLSQSATPRGSFIVINNKIGFGAADGTGTTTISGTGTEFRGIDAPNVDTTIATSIQGNTISGINQTSNRTSTTSTNSAFIGMLLGSSNGLFDVGGVTGNTIGSLDGSSTVVVNGLATAATAAVIGIYDFSFLNGTISNNNIGSFTIQGSGTTLGFRGVLVSGTAAATTTITANTIANITDTQVGSYALYGISESGSAALVTGNTIRNFTGNSNGGVVVMQGIGVSAATATNPSMIARNTVHSLRNTVVGGASGAIYALDFTFPSQANIVERNLVHSISVDTSFVGYQVNGILMRGGAAAPSTTTFRNNMIRLGFDAAGAAITAPLNFTGIRDSAGTNVANNYYHNSVYIGGSGVTGGVALTIGSTAFNSDTVTTTRNFQDNIFWNARSNVATGAALHVAIRVGGTTVNPPGLASNYNDLYASGNDGVVGVFNNFIYPTLANWQAATGQDANSFSEDPIFIAPNGSAITGDLHINPTIATPIEGTGLAIASVTDDFDGQLRAGLTPTDVGADAGNFVAQTRNLTISPTSVLFGQVAVGATSSESTVTLGNTGTGTLQVTALSAAAAPFARTGSGTCSATLPIAIAAGSSCTLTYTFAPTTNGPFNQTLTVTANAPGSGTIALQGTGIQGNLSITPSNVAFGNQTVGTTSSAMPVTFTNIGNAPVSVTMLTAPTSPFGTAALAPLEAPAGFVNCSPTPFTLAAGASCSVGYTFSPTATGSATQVLTATSSGLGGGTITLSGTGVQGALTITPTTVNFGNQSVGTTSSASTVTLGNSGDATLNVTTLTAANSPFARLGGTCGSTPIAITAGGSCTLTYTFSPTAGGPASQVLTVTSDAPGSGTIALSGTGVEGNLVISPTTVDFGSPDVFTVTEFMSVTLSNTGVGSLQVTSLTLAAAPFQRTTDGSCGNSLPITIAPAASCTLTYKFAPTTAGLQSQPFTVSSNSPGSGGMFTLSGTGVSDRIFQNGFEEPPPPPEPTP